MNLSTNRPRSSRLCRAWAAVVLLALAWPAMAGQPPRVGLLCSATPGVKDASLRNLQAALVAGGLAVDPLTADQLCAMSDAQAAQMAAMVAPDASCTPQAAAQALLQYAARGGKVAWIGPKPLTKPTVNSGGRWLTREKVRGAILASADAALVLSPADVAAGAWQHDFAPECGASAMTKDQGPAGPSVRIEVKNFSGWNTYATKLPHAIPAGHNVLLFWAKGDEATGKVAIELRDARGSRWIAAVTLAKEWKRYDLAPGDFVLHSAAAPDAPTLTYSDAVVLTLGLATTYTGKAPGDHTLWVGDIRSTAAAIPSGRDFIDVGLSCDVLAYRQQKGCNVTLPGSPAVELSNVAVAPVFAAPQYRISQLAPLAQAASAQGQALGSAAAVLSYAAGPYANSDWLLCGVELDAFAGSPAAMSWLAGKIAALARGDLHAAAQARTMDPAVAMAVTHAGGNYHLTNQNYLLEGVAEIKKLGAKSIKLWAGKPNVEYPFNANWPKVKSTLELLELPEFKQVLADPAFTTYFLVAFRVGADENAWKIRQTSEDLAATEQDFYELAKYLLTTYRDSGKTFVLQNWEGDWSIRPAEDPTIPLDEQRVSRMIHWLNARQKGVDRARQELGLHGVRVIHAAEVNQVRSSVVLGRKNVIDLVIPHTNVDMVSYSCYDSLQDPRVFRACLEHIAQNIPPKEGWSGCRVYIGEYGLPENKIGLARVKQIIPQVVDVSLAFGCPYLAYWELYCNEPLHAPVVKNEDCSGLWLIKPDGTKAWAWDFLKSRIEEKP